MPNAAHLASATLGQSLSACAIVMQNVDELHEQASREEKLVHLASRVKVAVLQLVRILSGVPGTVEFVASKGQFPLGSAGPAT